MPSTLIDRLRTLAIAEVGTPVLHRESVVVEAFLKTKRPVLSGRANRKR